MQPNSLQARLTENDPRLYNVNRDLAHNFGTIAKIVAARLEDKAWPELAQIMEHHDVTMDELGEACQAYCLFLGSQMEVPEGEKIPSADMEALLTDAGWFKVRPAAQVAFMATLGTVVTGIHFAGIREATLAGEGPAMTLQDIAARGREVADFLALPRWRRWVLRWRTRLRNALQSLRGHE